MTLDYYTMMFFIGIFALILGLISIAYIAITKSKKKCLWNFVVGKTLEGVGIFGIALRGQIPDFVSLHISNIMLITGIAFEIYAVTIYNSDFKKQIIIIFASITVIGAVLYTVFSEIYVIRTIIVSVSAGIITLIGGINLLKSKDEYKFPVLISISLFIYAISRFLQSLKFISLPLDFSPEIAMVDTITLLFGNISILSGIGFFLLLNEVDEQLIKDRNAELQELNKSKDKLFSIIAHDLKFPIATFNHLLETAEKQIKNGDTESVKQLVKLIKNNSRSTYELLDNLLNWSKNQLNNVYLKPEEFDIVKMVSDAINLFEANIVSKHIYLSTDYKGQFNVFADKETIKAVIRNLISNAVKFTPQKGEIEIRLKQESDKMIFSIKDSGIGIEPDRISNIFCFTENQRSKGTDGEPGTGLGLAISYEFLVKNKGKLWVESEIGKGSSFYFQLPVNSF